jgi:hypothetical protein
LPEIGKLAEKPEFSGFHKPFYSRICFREIDGELAKADDLRMLACRS